MEDILYLIGKLMKKNQFLRSILLSTLIFASPFVQVTQAQTATNIEKAAFPSPAPLHITKLLYIDTVIGTGDVLTNMATAQMHYTGWIYDNKAADLHGIQFDSSKNSGEPLSFQVGARQVIRGWDIGVLGMKVGGKRTLFIPAYLGYSVAGSNNIPPNTHLVFEVELVGITK
jgi:FKBP-type peptidyl-prolyl cis-trans isomerase FkpA